MRPTLGKLVFQFPLKENGNCQVPQPPRQCSENRLNISLGYTQEKCFVKQGYMSKQVTVVANAAQIFTLLLHGQNTATKF